jgi:hypothetical protein
MDRAKHQENKMNIEEFCDKYHACHDGRTWALKNCTTMDEVWKKCLRPEWIIWIATRPGVLKDTDLIRFAVWSVRQVQHLLTDPRGLAALDTVDRYLAGTATKEEVEAAADAAYAAARAAADAAYAARAAADAAYAAARAADAAAYAARAAADAAYAAYAARAAADAAACTN